MPPLDDRPHVEKPVPRRRDDRQRTTFGNRFRFLLRVLGLTGLLAVTAGLILVVGYVDYLGRISTATVSALSDAILGGEFGQVLMVAGFLVYIGGAAALAALFVELVMLLFVSAGRKTAVGTNMTLQVALAVLLLVIVNAISFSNYWRFDQTREQQFTLAPESIESLKTLRADSPTTVVVLQLHKTAGTLSDRPDALDSAAEKKVVEKVKDLVAELREFGPRFNVVVLDAHDERFERAVKELTRTRPGLAAAIANAPENSIFFYADEKVRSVARSVAEKLVKVPSTPDPDDVSKALVYSAPVARMSFTEFYQLDKTASKDATAAEREGLCILIGGPAFAPDVRGNGNLVLIPRGKEAFVRKVLSLEERRPKVALAIIDPILSTRENSDELSAGGMRQSLEANGYEVTDVIVKKFSRATGPTPAAYTYEESELDRAEGRSNLLSLLVADRELAIRLLTDGRAAAEKVFAAKTDEEKLPHLVAADRALRPFVSGRITTEAALRRILPDLDTAREEYRTELVELSRRAAEATARYRNLLADERAVENRRVTDVKAKLQGYVNDCDLLIVPRLTTVDIARGWAYSASFFTLAKEQAEVVKAFMKAGKPVLFALGPINAGRAGPEPVTDDVERLLGQFGIELGRQTIVTDLEAQAMAERQGESLGSSVELAPLSFDAPDKDGKKPNPVAAAFRVTSRTVDRKLDVKRSGYRPIYLTPGAAENLPFAGEIAFVVRESWNEEKPIPEDEYLPKFEPAKSNDAKKGTRDEERRGPFPIGVAIEAAVPIDWFDPPGDSFPALIGGLAAFMELPARKPTDEPEAVAGLTGTAVTHARVPVATRMFPGFGPSLMASAFTMPFDGGLYAALLTAAERQKPRPTVRVVALGHGGLFTGKKLDPAQETLLLHSLNWQLKRDDRLPQDVPDDKKWRYPRANLAPREFTIWRWGTFVGLPLLVVYFGLIALMIRKVR